MATRHKEEKTQMERALIAAKLSAQAYKTEKQAKQGRNNERAKERKKEKGHTDGNFSDNSM